MNVDNLVKMANRIGNFFEAMPDRDQALADIATHIRKFWEPRMRRDLLTHLRNGGADLTPLVVAALERYQSLLAESTEQETA